MQNIRSYNSLRLQDSLFVRLLAIIALIVTLGSCSIGNKYKGRNEALATVKADIYEHLDYIGVKKISTVDEYLGVENGATYYFILLKAETEEATYFATVRLIIRNDLSLSYYNYVLFHGGD